MAAMTNDVTTRNQSLSIGYLNNLERLLAPIVDDGRIAKVMDIKLDMPLPWAPHERVVYSSCPTDYIEKMLDAAVQAADQYINGGEYSQAIAMADALSAPADVDMISNEITRMCACFPSVNFANEYYPTAVLEELQWVKPPLTKAAIIEGFTNARRMDSRSPPSSGQVFNLVIAADVKFRQSVTALYGLKDRRNQLAKARDYEAERWRSWVRTPRAPSS